MADTKEIISCPACAANMEKVFIERVNFHLDICKNCGGIYFDNREFKKFDEVHENITEIEKALEDCKYIEINKKDIRVCPSCTAIMTKVGENPTIDDCYTCGAKFLDGKELDEYRSKYSNENERSQAFANMLQKIILTDLNKTQNTFDSQIDYKKTL